MPRAHGEQNHRYIPVGKSFRGSPVGWNADESPGSTRTQRGTTIPARGTAASIVAPRPWYWQGVTTTGHSPLNTRTIASSVASIAGGTSLWTATGIATTPSGSSAGELTIAG